MLRSIVLMGTLFAISGTAAAQDVPNSGKYDRQEEAHQLWGRE